MHFLLQWCFEGALQGPAVWAFAGSVNDAGAKVQQSIPSSTDAPRGGHGCGTGALPVLRSCSFSTCELLRMMGDGQHGIFSLQCPSRGSVNLHHCLFKEDGVHVRAMGNQTQRARYFQCLWRHWIGPGLSNCALNAWGFTCFFPTVLVNLMIYLWIFQ